jgi:hypothetical protein
MYGSLYDWSHTIQENRIVQQGLHTLHAKPFKGVR